MLVRRSNSIKMLLQLLFLQFFSFTFANPFHKYPYVFLLDVGNEEIQNAVEEQIRVSCPGGSLAMRYPAVGDGQTIVHVRVSGIDFGTDLKSNILEGGPGYKYVVLVFVGNQGVPYDAVITVKTIESDLGENRPLETSEMQTNEIENSFEDDDQPNANNKVNPISVNQELAQESAVVPKYISNLKVADEYDENDSAEDSSDDIKDIHIPEKIDKKQETGKNKLTNIRNLRYENEQKDQGEKENLYIRTNNERYKLDNENLEEDEDDPQSVANKNVHSTYNIPRPNSHDTEGDNENDREYKPKLSFSKDPVEIDQMFNDEEVHHDANKYVYDNQNSNDEDDNDEDDNDDDDEGDVDSDNIAVYKRK